MRPRKLPTSVASFGTLQPSAANASRNPRSLNCDSTDQVSGVATPGNASPTFKFDHTSVLAWPPMRFLRLARAGADAPARRGDRPRLQHVNRVRGDRELDVARVAEVLLDAFPERDQLRQHVLVERLLLRQLGRQQLLAQARAVGQHHHARALVADHAVAHPAARLVDAIRVRAAAARRSPPVPSP